MDCSQSGPSVHGIFQARTLGCHFLLQGIFPTQGLNPHLLFGKGILYYWATRKACKQSCVHVCVHAWLAAPSCPILCDPMDCRQPDSSVHGNFSRQEDRSGLLFSPSKDLPDPGIKPTSPVSSALQVDSLLLSHQASLKIRLWDCNSLLKSILQAFSQNVSQNTSLQSSLFRQLEGLWSREKAKGMESRPLGKNLSSTSTCFGTFRQAQLVFLSLPVYKIKTLLIPLSPSSVNIPEAL